MFVSVGVYKDMEEKGSKEEWDSKCGEAIDIKQPSYLVSRENGFLSP